jgi:hypothetical protein
MPKKITTLLQTIGTTWDQDPASRGAAKMAVGGALVAAASGISGALSNKLNPFDGNRSSISGLPGSLLGLLVGIVLVVVSSLIAPAELLDPVTVDGRLTETNESISSDSDGSETLMYSGIYEIVVDGESYEVRSSMTSSSRPDESVEITYPSANPDRARVTGGFEGSAVTIVRVIAWLVLLASLFGMLINIALLVFGVKLWRAGRKERAAHGATEGWFKDLVDLFSGRMAPEPTSDSQA